MIECLRGGQVLNMAHRGPCSTCGYWDAMYFDEPWNVDSMRAVIERVYLEEPTPWKRAFGISATPCRGRSTDARTGTAGG